MSLILDVVLVAGGAYYVAKRLGDKTDDSFQRVLYGTAAGLPAALKGPEAASKLKEIYKEPEHAITKDKIVSSLVLGGVGYILGDKIIGSDKQKTQK